MAFVEADEIYYVRFELDSGWVLYQPSLVPTEQRVFDEISAIAHDWAGRPAPHSRPARDRATVPYLNEPWYC